jgi:small basic protein (TIGR04137 family)
MSIDRSLRLKSSLARHRNVLTRAERVTSMQSAEAWRDGTSPLGLPKLGNRKVKAGKKPKKEAAAEGAEATPAAVAAPAAKAPAGKAAAGKAPAKSGDKGKK